MTTATHENVISLEKMLEHSGIPRRRKLESFAMLNLGVLESLRSGVLDAEMAIERFYNAGNCLYVRRTMKDTTCDEIMSRGVQLGDLQEILPATEAQRAFGHELDTMRTLGLMLLAPGPRRSGNGRSKRSTVRTHA